jgi:hypothetical protein
MKVVTEAEQSVSIILLRLLLGLACALEFDGEFLGIIGRTVAGVAASRVYADAAFHATVAANVLVLTR